LNPQAQITVKIQTGGTAEKPEFRITGGGVIQLAKEDNNLIYP
jgi:hypothetical protein